MESEKLFIEKGVGLVDEDDCDISNIGGGAIGNAGFIVGFVVVFATNAASLGVDLGTILPDFGLVDTKPIEKVFTQFLKAGFSDVGEANLGFARGGTGFGAFYNVLFPGTCGLNHLVYGAVTALEGNTHKVTRDEVNGDFCPSAGSRWREAPMRGAKKRGAEP